MQKNPELPDGWVYKLCRPCQIKKNETNRRNRIKQRSKSDLPTQADNDILLEERPSQARRLNSQASQLTGPTNLSTNVLPGSPNHSSLSNSYPTLSFLPAPSSSLDPTLQTSASMNFLEQFAVTLPERIAAIMNTSVKPYAYPETNSALIRYLSLEIHPLGGYIGQATESAANPTLSLGGTAQIFSAYRLFIPNARHTYFFRYSTDVLHLLHQGRARFTVLKPNALPNGHSELIQYTLGQNSALGEYRQAHVAAQHWCSIEIPEQDCAAAEQNDDSEYIGALMTTVSAQDILLQIPQFLTMQEFEAALDPTDFQRELFRKYIMPVN